MSGGQTPDMAVFNWFPVFYLIFFFPRKPKYFIQLLVYGFKLSYTNLHL
jgi:hypothetical protein